MSEAIHLVFPNFYQLPQFVHCFKKTNWIFKILYTEGQSRVAVPPADFTLSLPAFVVQGKCNSTPCCYIRKCLLHNNMLS